MAEADASGKQAVEYERKQLHSSASDSSERELSEAFGNAVNGNANESTTDMQDLVGNAAEIAYGKDEPEDQQTKQRSDAARLSPIEMYDPAKHCPPNTLSPKIKRLPSVPVDNHFGFDHTRSDLQPSGNDCIADAVFDLQLDREEEPERNWKDKSLRNGNVIVVPLQTYRKMQLELDQMRVELRLLADRNAMLTSENAKLRSKLVDNLKRRNFSTIPAVTAASTSTSASVNSHVSAGAKSIGKSVSTRTAERSAQSQSKRSVVDVHEPRLQISLQSVLDQVNKDFLRKSSSSSRSTSPTSDSEVDTGKESGIAQLYSRSRLLEDSLRKLGTSPSKTAQYNTASASLTRREVSSWTRSRYTAAATFSCSPSRYSDRLSSAHRDTNRWNDRATLHDRQTRSRPFAPKHHSEVRVGDDVKFAHRGTVGHARVRYVGHVTGDSRTHVGLELKTTLNDVEDSDGESNEYEHSLADGDGVLNGVRYFRTSPNRALFLPSDKILLVL